ncbi:MAG: S8 family peptidase, partial [Clostridia bacterium]
MNDVLELKGKRFVQAKKGGAGGGPAIHSERKVTSEIVEKLILRLCEIEKFWQNEKKTFNGVLLSVYYNKIVAKSNRISGLLKGKNSNSAIVGAKFNKEKDKHIITYFVETYELDNSIKLLTKTNEILLSLFKDGIGKKIFYEEDIFDKIRFDKYSLSKSIFKQIIADVSYIDDFAVDKVSQINKESIITLYNIGMDTKQLLNAIGIDILSGRILDNMTVYLDENQLNLLLKNAPYLVAMATENISDLSPDDFIKKEQQKIMSIPDPTIEPTIGVIDTLFDNSVYFSKWVDYHDMIDNSITKSQEDYRHGTEVTSIIVDGSRLNPWLNDGCGRFKVRHFGVAVGKHFSSFIIIKQIKKVVAANKDIKVWNISLGSNQEINDNFISAEAAVLDQIQFDNDVIFVVAGTNKPNESIKRIGSPADSINSMVVNSVTKSGKATNYSRTGLALSF